MATPVSTIIDGIGLDDLNVPAFAPMPGTKAGYKFKHLGQTSAALSGAVANQDIGFVALPAIAAGTTGTVTITNSLITTSSIIRPWVKLGAVADTTAGRGVMVWQESVSSGSAVLGYYTAALMSSQWEAVYEVIN